MNILNKSKNIFFVLSLLLVSGCSSVSLVELTEEIEVTSKQSSKVGLNISKNNYKIISNKYYKIANNEIVSEPAIHKDKIYSLDKSGNINIFSIDQKKILVSKTLKNSANDAIFDGGGILVINDKIYITNGTQYLIILDAFTGDELFRKKFETPVNTAPVLLANNIILIKTVKDNLIAYNFKENREVFQKKNFVYGIHSVTYIKPIVNVSCRVSTDICVGTSIYN